MDINDFLVEYDLTQEQRKFAARLKAQANLKQLVNCLGDHALFFSREVATQRRRSVGGRAADIGDSSGANTRASVKRDVVLAWFLSLDVGQRVSVLTCDDSSWVRTALKMSRLRGESTSRRCLGRAVEGRFKIAACKGPQAKQMGKTSGASGGGRAERSVVAAAARTGGSAGAVSSGKAARDPVVQYRRPHWLPDGEVLLPPGTDAHLQACDTLVAGVRAAFKGCCCVSLALEWDAVVISPRLVNDIAAFTAIMDEVSLGRFLRDTPSEPLSAGTSPWAEAAWLHQWGSHFPLAAFLGSRLEVLLLQGFAARAVQMPLERSLGLPLAEVWGNMRPEQRAQMLVRLNRSLFRRLLSETVATNLGEFDGRAWELPRGLADLFSELDQVSLSRQEATSAETDLTAFLQQPPLDFVAAVTTVSLPMATEALDDTMKEVLLRAPRMWLHQQFAEELAIACSEHSANTLLEAGRNDEERLAQGSRRCEKKHRQKLRRKQAGEEVARQREADRERLQLEADTQQRHREAQVVVADLLREMLDTVVGGQRHETSAQTGNMQSSSGSSNKPREVAVQVDSVDVQVGAHAVPCAQPVHAGMTGPLGMMATFLSPVLSSGSGGMLPAGPSGILDDWDGHTSELSSIGVATSRSESIYRSPLQETAYLDSEWLRARRRPIHARRRCHDDSRLEFLLRSRDRYRELEWDHMSQGSLPASLDEALLYPVGLEGRFAYLFDSPSCSRVTTALGSQAAAEDDAERLGAPWEDLEEWRSITQALEKTEQEREMWQAKAHELESRLASGGHGGGSACSSLEEPCPPLRPSIARQRSACSTDDVVIGGSATPTSSSRGGGGCGVSLEISAAGNLNDSGTAVGSSRPSGSKSPQQCPLSARRRRLSSADGSDTAPSTDHAWRYLVLLALARRQIDMQRSVPSSGPLVLEGPQQHACGADAVGGVPRIFNEDAGVSRSLSMPGLGLRAPAPSVEERQSGCAPQDPVEVTSARQEASRSPSPPSGNEVPASSPSRGYEAPKRALHAAWDARYKRSSLCDSATQTAPAITLSKMYGGMVPRYIQRELARLRQENQILRYRVASLAMSQPLSRPRPVRHQATQTAPALTFSTGRQQGSGGQSMPMSSFPRLPPAREIGGLRLPSPKELCGVPSECLRFLDVSIHAFVHAVELQTQSQDSYRLHVQALCKRAVQMLWPRSSVELVGSFASSLALPSSGLDLVIYLHRIELRRMAEGPGADQRLLCPIDEDADQLRPMPLGHESPGHPGSMPSPSSGWQQQLSCRLAQEKWVVSDSIRVTAHAAIPVLSLIAAPEEDTPHQDSVACPVRVDIQLEDPNHCGHRSKAMISWLLSAFPHARPVTLVLKQWLMERTYGMSHTGGLCSYGLLLMVIGFLQHHQAASPAEALVGCLNFYGRRFDAREYGVSVARGSCSPFLPCSICTVLLELGCTEKARLLGLHLNPSTWKRGSAPLRPRSHSSRGSFLSQVKRLIDSTLSGSRTH
mmetsp:Transcript_16904/g.54676  ORF Transcript_16904/g.54676 Transcript_16904/m.54676 type:complete len:1495 (-) Transcript_16904:464-4948(-)